MARTSESEVRDIYSAHPDGTAQDADAVAFAVEAANDYVTTHLGSAGLAADVMQRVEALVAAHLLTAGDPVETEFDDGVQSATFEGADLSGEGLKETRFGRRALLLDTSGTLATSGATAPSSFSFHGVSHDSGGAGGA